MASRSAPKSGATIRTVDLNPARNWPVGTPEGEFWQALATRVERYPHGRQRPWGIPFRMGPASGPRAVVVGENRPEVTVPLRGRATHLCFLHEWQQIPGTECQEDPTEGLLVAEYELRFRDGTTAVLPVRARFEVAMKESPGPPWLAVGFSMPESVDPVAPPAPTQWGRVQTGIRGGGWQQPSPLLCAMENPWPGKSLAGLTIRGLRPSPLIVAGVTLYRGTDSPLRHLPRRLCRVTASDGQADVESADVDFGTVTRIEKTAGPRGKRWLSSTFAGLQPSEPPTASEDLVEVVAARDATLSVRLSGRKTPLRFSVGDAFDHGSSTDGEARCRVLGRRRQWMRVRVVDRSTGKPTPVRLHMSGARGEYLAPYGHHTQVNANWFEDYGADLVFGGRSYAYVPGEFTTDLPIGPVFIELTKGFEYKPVRTRVQVRSGEKELTLSIERWCDRRSHGWVTADTHVHFISPHTAWLEGQAEGVNVVNLLASQWGRLFTNVGDITGTPGVDQDDTIVFVGTENRNHMLGHMSMLGTQGRPVYPMCCGGVGESWIGDPDFRMLAEWALENRRKGGVVIRPHYPFCGHTEDPVPILKGLVDALEIRGLRGNDFPTQEWYRYLNCGYRVAVCGGTDKMGAYTALGWLRTYAKIEADRPLTYDAWAEAVRAGRTVSSTGPLLDMHVDGRPIGDTISMGADGGTVEVEATAECFVPLGILELVVNGRVVAKAEGGAECRKLHVRENVRIDSSGWVAARCSAHPQHPGSYMAAHTSPVYVVCGDSRPFSGPAAEHMLGLVEGGIEYLNKLATVFDEPSRKRMVKLFNEARQELKGRLLVEDKHTHHHGDGLYHTHGHGTDPNHRH